MCNTEYNCIGTSNWDKYKDYTYAGTLDGLYQHTLISTGTRLRPVEATFVGHILGTKPAKILKACGLMPPAP